MKQGFSAGCSLEVTLKFADYENLKPSFWAGITREFDSSLGETLPEYSDLLVMISDAQDACRKICEEKIDTDIYEVKQVKVFSQIKYKDKDTKGK